MNCTLIGMKKCNLWKMASGYKLIQEAPDVHKLREQTPLSPTSQKVPPTSSRLVNVKGTKQRYWNEHLQVCKVRQIYINCATQFWFILRKQNATSESWLPTGIGNETPTITNCCSTCFRKTMHAERNGKLKQSVFLVCFFLKGSWKTKQLPRQQWPLHRTLAQEICISVAGVESRERGAISAYSPGVCAQRMCCESCSPNGCVQIHSLCVSLCTLIIDCRFFLFCIFFIHRVNLHCKSQFLFCWS